MAKISVLIPVYNSEKYLRECLESIQRQSFENFSVIIIDDGSKDSSYEICESFAIDDVRFKLYHQDNMGAGAARNKALDYCFDEVSDYIVWVDADDVIHPEYLELLYTAIENHPECDIVQCGYTSDVSIFNLACKEEIDIKLGTNYYSSNEMLRRLLTKTDAMLLWNKIFRKELYSEVRVYTDENITGKINNDVNMLWRLYYQSRGCVHCPACLYYYRTVSGSIQHKKINIEKLEYLKLIKWMWTFFQNKMEFQDYAEYLSERYIFNIAYQLKFPKSAYADYKEFYRAIKKMYKESTYDMKFVCKRVDIAVLQKFGSACFYFFRIYGRMYNIIKNRWKD